MFIEIKCRLNEKHLNGIRNIHSIIRNASSKTLSLFFLKQKKLQEIREQYILEC